MASFYRDGSRNGWRVQIYVRGFRRKLWLGPVSKSAARAVAAHLEALNLARDTGTVPPAETRRWANSIAPRLRNRLADWGLLQQSTAAARVPGTLGDFAQHYIDSRTDWSQASRNRMANVRRLLVEKLGHDTALAAITPGDAESFARWARSTIKAKSHSGKTISDARQFFTAAVKHYAIAENPFAGINASQPHRKDREFYVSRETINRVIAKADPYFAAVIACARFGGLRTASEHLSMEWSTIDWAAGRFAVHSTKTGATRMVPLFPELRPHLALLLELAPDGARFPFDRYRTTANKVYRSNLLRLLKAAGVDQWPKIWQNCRASCRTDLLADFPDHVVNYWLGHTGAVGSKHYDRVHDGHFEQACGVARGVVSPLSVACPRPPE